MMNAMAMGMQQRVQQEQISYAYVDTTQQAPYQKF
jgi:hypothetical protein